MQSSILKIPERKVTGSDFEFEIKFIPLPKENLESWQAAMKVLNVMIEKAIEEQRLAVSAQQLACSENLEKRILRAR